MPSLIEFIHTRSAYIGQTSLYGYLKARMGTRYRQIFEDPTFQEPLNTAKWRTFGVCLQDLGLFAVATIAARSDLSSEEAQSMARHCMRAALDATFDECTVEGLRDEISQRFDERAAHADWNWASEGENAFAASPDGLIDAAPVIDQFKEWDGEIVRNSIRFRWRDVRTQLRERIDGEAICAQWRERGK